AEDGDGFSCAEDGDGLCFPHEALVAAKGTAYITRTRTMTSVAIQAAARFGARGAGGPGVSGAQAVPFQNVIRYRLHSAARPAQGAPWLCGPASRRGCLFVDARIDSWAAEVWTGRMINRGRLDNG